MGHCERHATAVLPEDFGCGHCRLEALRARVKVLEGAILKHIDKTEIERGARMYGTQADQELWEMVAAREEE